MRNKLIIILGLLILLSCSNEKSQQGQRELLPDPEKYVQDGYTESSDKFNQSFNPDTSIASISLINPKNVEDLLGEKVMDRLNEDGLPNLSVHSSDSKQSLRVFFHPGNGANELSEFQVSYNDQKDRTAYLSQVKEFKTESGIKLGITIGLLRSIKGEPDSITENESTVFHYKMEGIENSDFLKRYNMPIYYADYHFNNGYLIKFTFGFEYP